jgi:hypothetical protein
MRFLLLFPVLIAVLFSACKPHVCTPNPVFSKLGPETSEYKQELVKQLSTAKLSDIDFYIGDYTREEDRHYIEVAMHGRQFCAYTTMEITNCPDMAHLIEVKGMSYRSAGISNPVFHIDSTSGNYNFVLTDLEDIID